MSQMRRGLGGGRWLLWWLKSWNGLANKLQNVMFSKTRTNGMYSNSAARAGGTRVQSARKFCAKTLTHHLLIFIFFFKRRVTSSQIHNEIYLRNICMLLSTNRSTEVFLHISAKIKAPSTFINASFVILLILWNKIKDNNNDINNYPTTAVLIHLL